MCADEQKRNWLFRVKDILNCIEKIQSYTDGLSFDQFQNDSMRVDAVLHNFEIIGESASHIPEAIQEKYPELAWLEMRGMRNIVAHEYFGVSLSIIWETIQRDLLPLYKGMKSILNEYER